MSVPEYHDAIFRWPHSEANEVIITGEFDGWSASRHLARYQDGFEGVVQVPWGTRVHYKFVVDGRWTVVDGQPTEYDPAGNLNNVFDSPAKPPTAKGSETQAPIPEPTLIVPTLPAGQANGLIATVKQTAVAIVEAIAPGTTETPAETPVVETVPEPATQTEEVEEVIAEEEFTETTDGDLVVEEEVVEEIKPEAVLPAPVEEITVAPVIPVPVLPLNTGEETKQLETTNVEGSATSQPAAAVEPSTHTPVSVPKINGHTEKAPEVLVVEGSAVAEPAAAEASTHFAASPADKGVPINGTTETHTHIPMRPLSPKETPITNGTAAEPSTEASAVAVAEEPAPAVTSKEELKPETVPLPLPTPAEVPLPVTPAANDGGKKTPERSSSTNTTPQASPLKEKKHAFPSFGRHSRRSSSSVSVSTRGTVDEHGALETPSRNATTRKKRNSFFAKIKEIFTDHEHQHPHIHSGEQKK